MNYKIIDKTILLSLEKDAFINKSIKKIFEEEDLRFGWISGLGAIHNVHLGYYDTELKKYIDKIFEKDYELLSITGNVSYLKSEYFVHTHISMSNQDFKAYGGHLFDAQIAAAGEFRISLLDCKIDRKLSTNIGLNLWCIENENN